MPAPTQPALPARPIHVTIHACDRLARRHGVEFSREEWNRIALAIIDRQAVLLRLEDHSEIWLVESSVGPLRVVWRPRTATIVTILGDQQSGIANYRLRDQRNGWRHYAKDNADDERRRIADREWQRALRGGEAAE